MTKTITGTFNSEEIRSVFDDLIASGVEREKVIVDNDRRQLKVMFTDDIETEILEILVRHHPGSLHGY